MMNIDFDNPPSLDSLVGLKLVEGAAQADDEISEEDVVMLCKLCGYEARVFWPNQMGTTDFCTNRANVFVSAFDHRISQITRG